MCPEGSKPHSTFADAGQAGRLLFEAAYLKQLEVRQGALKQRINRAGTGQSGSQQ